MFFDLSEEELLCAELFSVCFWCFVAYQKLQADPDLDR